MKLILTHEVANLGAPGDVVEVKNGYGRNYLVPRGLAIQWTKGAEKQIATIKKAREVRDVRDLGHAEEIKSQLEAKPVNLQVRAGSGGRLFGAVTVTDIVTAADQVARRSPRRRTDPPGGHGEPRAQRRTVLSPTGTPAPGCPPGQTDRAAPTGSRR